MIDIIQKMLQMVSAWRNEREGDTTLFSFGDFFSIELISFHIVMMSDSLKPRRISDIVINFFGNCQESEGRETKKYDFETIIFIFKFFKLMEI